MRTLYFLWLNYRTDSSALDIHLLLRSSVRIVFNVQPSIHTWIFSSHTSETRGNTLSRRLTLRNGVYPDKYASLPPITKTSYFQACIALAKEWWGRTLTAVGCQKSNLRAGRISSWPFWPEADADRNGTLYIFVGEHVCRISVNWRRYQDRLKFSVQD